MSDPKARIPGSLLVPLALLALYLAGAYVRGPDSYVRINDHLDGIVPMYRVLAETQPFLGGLDDRVDAIFDGVPRNSLPSVLHLGVLLYFALGSFWGYVANEALLRGIGLVGMFLLLRRYVAPALDPRLAGGASLCFALLPFMHTAYLSVMGQPLVLWAILNLRARRGGPVEWGVLAVFALYSSLIFAGFFVLAGLGALVLWDLWRSRRLDGRLVAAGALLAALYAASEYRLLYQTFFAEGYVSHRSEYVRVQGSWKQVVWATFRTFFLSHRHAGSVQTPFLLGSAGLALGLGAWFRVRHGASLTPGALLAERDAGGRRPPWVVLLGLVLLAGAIALLIGIWEWSPVQALVESAFFAPIRMFNFQRLQWFQPLVLGLVFAVSLHVVARRARWGTAVAVGLVAAQAGWAAWHTDPLKVAREEGLTFREYYSPALFREIREHIGRPPQSYRVVSFGLTPGIALHNGFYALDGFVNDYPLEYKYRFRRVIEAELAEDEVLQKHFDQFGGHVDLLSAELGRVSGYAKTLYTKNGARRKVEDLEIDVAALRELGADYVLSAVEIGNHRELGLVRQETFEHPDSPWRIILYAVPGAEAHASRGRGAMESEAP